MKPCEALASVRMSGVHWYCGPNFSVRLENFVPGVMASKLVQRLVPVVMPRLNSVPKSDSSKLPGSG